MQHTPLLKFRNIMGGMIRQKISYAIQDVTFYSVLVDETKQVSKIEQLFILCCQQSRNS